MFFSTYFLAIYSVFEARIIRIFGFWSEGKYNAIHYIKISNSIHKRFCFKNKKTVRVVTITAFFIDVLCNKQVCYKQVRYRVLFIAACG
ncbi:hypothetical protein SU60_10215 [Vibrio mytili]|uniref:Uncharacterized protein n=1 Tax=Vibrio mytili TaxID=50718 RepID=A0A0C3E8Y6_9VIBR|nr:hypothetical protein SU60_10215 [Vibrio mytili]